jgi:hypothetical protein
MDWMNILRTADSPSRPVRPRNRTQRAVSHTHHGGPMAERSQVLGVTQIAMTVRDTPDTLCLMSEVIINQ